MPRNLVFVIVLVCLTGSAGSQLAFAQSNLWRPYAEAEGRAGGLREQGRTNFFVPLQQDNDSVLFFDARGGWDDLSGTAGSWGLAYRTVLQGEWIFGVNGFYDLRNTENNNTFSQGGVGLELLDVNRGFRLNAYIPGDDVESAAGVNGAFLENGNIVVRSGLEAAYAGVDFEAERLMWFRDGNGSGVDVELWASAGVFHFDNSSAGFEAITGPRFRTELRLFDLPMLGRDSRLVLAGQFEHDSVRDSQGTGIVSIRIPFGGGNRRKSRRLRGLDRRMVAPIVRDTIVTNAVAFTEAANIASTGQAISQAVVIDANTPGPEGVVAGAGTNSVVIVDGSAGAILPGGSIVTNNGQVLLGGGSGLAVIGSDTGTAAIFNAPGSRPTINNSNPVLDTIEVATDASVIGVDVIGGRNGIATAGFGTLSAGSQILNNSVTGAADNGFRTGDVAGTVANNTATDSGDNGFRFVDVSGTFSNNTATGSGDRGFDFISVLAGGTFTNNTAAGSGLDGFLFGSVSAGGTFSNNTATGSGSNGFQFADVLAGGTFSNNTATGSGRDAMGGITNVNANGFSFFTNSGTFAGNMSIFNANNGFSRFNDTLFDQNGGTFTGNIANINGDRGFRGNNNAGTVNTNTNTGAGNINGGNNFGP